MNKHQKALLRQTAPPKLCNGKVCYDKRGATTARNFARDARHVALRIYPCPYVMRGTQHWHLTSH